MANPDHGSYGSDMGNSGNMGIPGNYVAGMFGPAPWLFGNPGMYQGYPGYQDYGGFQGNQGYPGYQGYQGVQGYPSQGQAPMQQAGGLNQGQGRGMPAMTPANMAGMSPRMAGMSPRMAGMSPRMAGMSPRMAGMYPQGYAGSSQFWQGMPNPYQPGATQQGQRASWPPSAAGMYPQGFGGSAPFWRQRGQRGQQQLARLSQQPAGPHAGHGPAGYQRSDERVMEDVHDRLTSHGQLDARGITATVNDGEVTLSGTVDSRQARHAAEDVAESVPGVRNVQDQLKVRQPRRQSGQQSRQPGQQPLQGWERFEGISAPHGLQPTQQAEQRAWQAGSLH